MTAPPKNQLVAVINALIDGLIKGLGVDAAIALATAEAPWLGLPIVKQIFRFFIDQIASVLDENVKRNVDIIVIRYQNDARKVEYDAAIDEFKRSPDDPQALQKAKDAIDRIVNRNKP